MVFTISQRKKEEEEEAVLGSVLVCFLSLNIALDEQTNDGTRGQAGGVWLEDGRDR